MKYHFRVGRGKNIIINDNETFEMLGRMVLNEYRIEQDHLFMFEFPMEKQQIHPRPLEPLTISGKWRLIRKSKVGK